MLDFSPYYLFHLHAKIQKLGEKDVLLPSFNLFIDLSSVSEQVPTGLFFFWLSLVLFRTIQLEWVF